MILYIDTTDFNKVVFVITDGKKIRKQIYKIDPHKSHEMLARLDEFLHRSKILNPKSEIKKIMVNKGPGSYTGIRVGVAVAQALGFAWGLPVKAVTREAFKKTFQ